MKDNNGILENSIVAMSVINKKDRATHKVIKELVDNNISLCLLWLNDRLSFCQQK